MVLGWARPALAEEIPQTTQPQAQPPVPALPQTWGPQPAPPAYAGPLYTTCAPTPEPSPVYTRWSFWLSVGVAVTAGVLIGVLYERRNHGLDMPSTTFGVKEY
jgi:hypothetical protein